MPRLLLLSFLVLSFFSMNLLHARNGKVFFSNGRWLKGDIQVQQDHSGKEVVVIALNSGSVTVQKSEVKNIIYASKEATPNKNFHRAFQNTLSKPISSKSHSLYDPYIRLASSQHQLDPELVRAVIKQESNFNRGDVSKKGAQGLMQLMPNTARELGVEDAFDPWENINGGTRYLKMMLENFNGDLSKALAAYNAGPEAVRKYGRIPPYQETQGYVKKVLRYYQMYRGSQLVAFEDKNGSLIITDQPFLR